MIDYPESLRLENRQRYGLDVSWWSIVQACGGWNEALDAILEDTLPPDIREEANLLVSRQELIGRAQFRLARELQRLRECR